MHNARVMATPKPGEIRCPTCHRSTPPATFCTQCGSAIPPDARIRPRGMDRDELQERIRARRSGGDPYRRGASIDEDRGGHQRFEPDAYDANARRAAPADDRRRDYLDEAAAAGAGAAASAPAGDLTRDRDEWSRPAVAPTPAAAPPPPTYAAPPSDVPVHDPPEHIDNFDDDAAYDEGEYPYEYEAWDEPRERRSGAGGLAILGFLALGVLALLGGAVLAGVFGDDPNTGQIDTSPLPSLSAAALPSATASVEPSGAVTPAPSGSPAASGDPVVFPDGFTAEAQPCLPGSAGGSGCDSNGASNTGVVDIWVGFRNGTGSDVIGATLVAPDGSTVDGSIDLARINCGQSCNGWTYFPFRNLTPGTYTVEITRNGEPASETTFEVV